MVLQWVRLKRHGKGEVQVLSVSSMYIVPVSISVPSETSGLLPQTEGMQIKFSMIAFDIKDSN